MRMILFFYFMLFFTSAWLMNQPNPTLLHVQPELNSNPMKNRGLTRAGLTGFNAIWAQPEPEFFFFAGWALTDLQPDPIRPEA